MVKTYSNTIIGQDHYLDDVTYENMYRASIENPDQFWGELAQKFISWFKPWKTVSSGSLQEANVRYFEGGKLNVCYNCVDRHLKDHANETAIIWEDDNPDTPTRKLSYQQLHDAICRLANGLKSLGIKKGDRVSIYLPMIPEAAIAMLACARIGAVHSVVFAGFSASALAERINDTQSKAVITADGSYRGGKLVPLKENIDSALTQCPSVEHVIVVNYADNDIDWIKERDIAYQELTASQNSVCEPEVMDAEDPLFILYTSGSTGKPKGILHTSGGYLLFVTVSHHYKYNYRPGEVYWYAADIGWAAGHAYVIYGSLANRATNLLYAGIPTYPDASRYWQIIEKHKVSVFFTAITAIRTLMSAGRKYVEGYPLNSLKLLGIGGEPSTLSAWKWLYKNVGKGRCPIIDSWGQTETAGALITSLPGVKDLKPCAVCRPFFGIEPVLLDTDGNELEGEAEGLLAIKSILPGIMREIYGNQQLFFDNYLKPYPGYYLTGDAAKRDADGDYWIKGRTDDTIIVSGRNLSSIEIENVLTGDGKVVEAAAVAIPDAIKGQGIYAFIVLEQGTTATPELADELDQLLRENIGPLVKLDKIQVVKQLPKTRSGKIMRRILRKIACGEIDDLGDTSTLADPDVIKHLLANKT